MPRNIFHYQARAQPIDLAEAPAEDTLGWLPHAFPRTRSIHRHPDSVLVAPVEHEAAAEVELDWWVGYPLVGQRLPRRAESVLVAPLEHETPALVDFDWWMGVPIRGRVFRRGRASQLVAPVEHVEVGQPSDTEWLVPPNPIRGKSAPLARLGYFTIDPEVLNLPSPPEEGEAPVIETPILAGAPGRPQLVGGEYPYTQLRL